MKHIRTVSKVYHHEEKLNFGIGNGPANRKWPNTLLYS
jgi:hypothetical protein